jgi:hypothetical protein
MNTKVILATANENYPGVGEFSTKETEISLNNDPKFTDLAIVPFNINGDVINFELRQKEWEVVVTGLNGQTTPTYRFSAFGVKQPNGTVYGNSN